ncbi:DUF4337 domain-containing protein [Sporomusa sp.]|uniref:DUF4337 domain-containing protein n=1 Tax=Sporomusa sp. TaxID=2078658 RepID=UPI002C835B53|nr:DUF4337 domain-containing protein [Sporomusa sp.]HWR42120.1 DUF4337 domain-containing protein [Sporomusa sp.]
MENSQEAKKSWKENIGTFIAVTTLVLAVCASLAAFKAAGYGNKMVLAQNQASDQWSYYQAKSIKETTYQVQRDTIALAAQESGKSELYKNKLAEYDEGISRYKNEKDQIADNAKRLEKERDTAQHFNGNFGQALVFLQIGILFSSLASINKAHIYWYMGLFTGGIGIAIFLYTFVGTMA